MKPYTHVLFNNHAVVLLDADEPVRKWLKITNRAYEVIKYLVENAFHRKKNSSRRRFILTASKK